MRPFKSAFSQEFLAGYQKGVMSYCYRGVRCLKSPIDIAIYMKALWDLKPRLILEIGSHSGGSALLLADIAQIYGLDCRIVSVDLETPASVSDDRISFVRGDVHDIGAVFGPLGLGAIPHPWFITEDSAHSFQGCLRALEFLGGVMASGDLLSMEDGILDELGLSDRYDGGPNRAIRSYLQDHPGVFEVVSDLCDMFGRNATYSPNGYLRKL
jgi:cephalosporin hydroxylase